MQNLSTLLAPLLRKKAPWEWKEEQQEAFDKTKALLQVSKVVGTL